MSKKTSPILTLIAVVTLTVVCHGFFIKSGVSASTISPSNSIRAGNSLFDPNSYYRLTTMQEGECKSLDIVNDANKNHPVLARSGNFSGQYWKITPVGNGSYRLTNQWQGDGKSLDIVKDGNSYKPILAATGNVQGQNWIITPTKFGENYFRLTTRSQVGKSLSVVDDGNNKELILGATGGYGEQVWKVSKEQVITTPPASLGLNSFYKKYLDAGGLPVISSDKVPDEALYQVRLMTLQMLSKMPYVLAEMKRHKAQIAVMAKTEVTLDIPEHASLQRKYPDVDWNQRARGLGGTIAIPTSSCAEENLLCYADDRYKGEDIFIHEFAHSIHKLGLVFLYPWFQKDLDAAYSNAKSKKLWANTYAITNAEEYFAEGVQGWFNVNLEANPANGIHNYVNTRAELKTYDIELYNLLERLFPEDKNKCSCQ